MVNPSRMPSGSRFRSVELFGGCGGLALGVERAGFRHEAVIERDERAAQTLKQNSGWPVECCDVCGFDWKPYRDKVELLSGGPPCQPFSVAGKHRAGRDRRDMFPEAAKAIAAVRPAAFLLENVAGLARDRFKPYLGSVIRDLENCGPRYLVAWAVVNAADYGVPQFRRRMFIVGFRRDLGMRWVPPSPTHRKDERVTVAEALADLPDPEFYCDRTTFHDHHFQPNARAYKGHTGSPAGQPAKTLKAGVHGVPGGENMLRRDDGTVRYFSVREAARLQTFPDEWRFYGSWTDCIRQIGNAVPVLLAQVIASSVYRQLASHADV